MDMKPGRRLLALIFLAAAALLAASMAFTYRSGVTAIAGERKMAGQLMILQELEDFFSSLKDTETGQRGYLLTGEESYLQPYTNGLAQLQTELDALERLGAREELSRERVERVARLTRQKLAEIDRTIQLRRDKGLEAALEIVRADVGREVMTQIRAEVREMRNEEQEEFRQAGHSADWAVRIRNATFVAVGLLNLAFFAWAFRKVSREMGLREASVLEI